MYPYPIIKIAGQPLLYLYDLFILIGVLAAFFFADRMTVKRGFSVTLQKIVIIAAVVAVVAGYGSAVLFQAFYNFMETGKFELAKNTGATFYGGFIGGTVTFLLVYFLAGKRFCKEDEAKKKAPEMFDIAACCVPLAHAFGRIGCLMAGCCHGKPTEKWYGIRMYVQESGSWEKVVPTQLFESLFLFALAAVLIVLLLKLPKEKRLPLLPIYALSYGIFRFILEIFRDDSRGETIVSFLTPSQLIALLLMIAGIAWLAVFFVRKMRIKNNHSD